MITDGAQTRSGKKGPYTPLAQASQPLKDKGVDVWTIGIGKRVNITELQIIASDPKKVIVVSSFKELKPIIEELQRKACEGMYVHVYVVNMLFQVIITLERFSFARYVRDKPSADITTV